jgi:hypothetical protein
VIRFIRTIKQKTKRKSSLYTNELKNVIRKKKNENIQFLNFPNFKGNSNHIIDTIVICYKFCKDGRKEIGTGLVMAFYFSVGMPSLKFAVMFVIIHENLKTSNLQ